MEIVSKNAEIELRISEEKFRAIFENTGIATCMVEEDSTIVNVRFASLCNTANHRTVSLGINRKTHLAVELVFKKNAHLLGRQAFFLTYFYTSKSEVIPCKTESW